MATLCRLLAEPEAREVRAVVLSPRQLSDLDLLLNGGFSPVRGFLGRADYESVLDTMRLESGLLWPVPVTLDVPEAAAGGLTAGDRLALQDPEGFTRALLTVGEVWRPDKRREVQAVYGTDSTRRALPLRADPQYLHRRYRRGHRAARTLRFREPLGHARRAARAVRADGLAPGPPRHHSMYAGPWSDRRGDE